MKVVRQSKVMNLLKYMKEVKCEMGEEKKNKKCPRATFHCSLGITLNKLQINCHLKSYQTLTQTET